MTNEENNNEEEEKKVYVDDELVKEYSGNEEIINFVKNKFKRMPELGAINLVRKLLWNEIPINIDSLLKNPKSFIRYNLSKIDKNNNIKLEIVKYIRRELNGFLFEVGKEIPEIEDDKGKSYFVLDRYTTYKKVRKFICDEGGKVDLKYNFDKPDIKINIPKHSDVLQYCQIQILTQGVKFDFPVEYIYACPQCHDKTRMKSYEMVSTNSRLTCPGRFDFIGSNGEPRSRRCGLGLVPDSEISKTKQAYYFDIGYDDTDGKKHPSGALSFSKYKPGYYDCVLFKIKNPKKTELYQLIDVKPIKSNKFVFPDKIKGENYVFTLQKAFDKFIKKQTGMEIYGLIPIKVSYILQTVMNIAKQTLVGNIQVVGDASTGKSTILKFYGFLLNNHLNLSSNGLSISIPALRGTRESINLMGKESKIVTIGYLGTYRSIHIDEAGENKELVQNLKTFLADENYSYDKAGATGIFNRRTTHVNVSENLDYNHLGQYRGTIRKAYKELTIKIGEKEKPAWSENWDLHLPIFQYDNPYLHKVVKEKRLEYKQKQQFWIDGYDYALHERFPFYFYLVNEKKDIKFKQVVKGNIARGIIKENLVVMRALKSNDIENFFTSLSKYVDSDTDFKKFDKVDDILEQYGVHTDSRIDEFFYGLVRVSRILNKRSDINEDDYNLLRWLLEKINCKLDVSNTTDYKIKGAPDLKSVEDMEKKIEDETVESDNEFGIPNGEF